MRKMEKTKQQLVKEINFLRKQIEKLEKADVRPENKENASKEFDRVLEDEVECRTSAERIILKQLHHEIELRKKTEQAVQDAFAYADNIVNTVREPLVVLDGELMVISANRTFYKIFNVKPAETEKRHIFTLGNGQWDIPKLRELLEDILPKNTSFEDFEVEHDFPDVGKRMMLLNAREIYRKVDCVKLILLAIEDITERRGLEKKLEFQASHDELTGCMNFRSITELLEHEIDRSRRYQKKFSVVMIDLDHFKRINDEHGHLAGNDVLAFFAKAVHHSVRSIDVVGRYGGDEFIIILPESDSRQASVVIARIRSCLAQTKVLSAHLKKEQGFMLEFSAGTAVFPQDAKDIKELIWFADNALRQAKQEVR